MSSLFDLFQTLMRLRPFALAKEALLPSYEPTQYAFLNDIALLVVIGVSMMLFMVYKKAKIPVRYDFLVAVGIIMFTIFLSYHVWFWLLVLCGFGYLGYRVKLFIYGS